MSATGVSVVRKVTALAAGAALLLAGTGCGVSAQQAVRHGAVRWYVATGIAPTTLPPVEVHEAYGTFKCGKQTVTGCYHQKPEPIAITIDVARSTDEVLRTGAHEWGHHLGLPDWGRGIMGPQSAHATSACITTEDVAMACVLYDCLWWRPECL